MPQSLSELLSSAVGLRPRARTTGPITPAAPLTAPTADQLAISAVNGPLAKLAAGTEPTPAEWQVLGRQVAGMNRAELSVVSQRLQLAGFVPTIVGGGRYATFQSPNLTVTVEPATGRMRRTAGAQAELYERGIVTTRYSSVDGLITVQRAKRTEAWTAAGQGMRSGRSILALPAALVPGEAPRVPEGIPPRNQFRQPIYKAGEDPAEFLAKVDAAVVRAGGEILVSANASLEEPDWHNCFSHALSGGEGDLADPFDRPSMPRWLLQPHFQLNGGRFEILVPEQRVHPGDRIIYKLPGSEAITHVAIVREVDAGGNPSKIESKFGAWGTYVHKPFDVLTGYGVPAGFYRAK